MPSASITALVAGLKHVKHTDKDKYKMLSDYLALSHSLINYSETTAPFADRHVYIAAHRLDDCLRVINEPSTQLTTIDDEVMAVIACVLAAVFRAQYD